MDSLLSGLRNIFPDSRIRSRLIDRVAYASDAGFYHLLPRVIVQPYHPAEVAKLFALCRELHVPLTFRAGGSSLSGQAITDGVLVDLSRHWRIATPASDGSAVRVQPGITGSMVNQLLKRYRTKIGPDPASINTAMMGGILSNNSSGMCCGVRWNAYHTLRSIRFLLPDGNEYDTADSADYPKFKTGSPALYQALTHWREEIRNDPALHDRIRHKYRTKNTVGYSLNAFIDFEHPLDIFAHLLIGAEGTLGFIAEAVLHTIPDHPCKATALLLFTDMTAACSAVAAIKAAGAEMIELMDRASLSTAAVSLSAAHLPPSILSPDTAALLVEFQAPTDNELQQLIVSFPALRGLRSSAAFTTDPATRDRYWKIRKGLFPSVGAVRKKGTTVILEDIAFPVDRLAPALADLRALFSKYEYDNAIIFGHAKDGNIHFVITQSFNTPEEVERYRLFMDEVVKLVIDKYDGTLKAEHGTGRNMAPFVETEWGAAAYRIMKQLKELVDPQNILNPGVIINGDKHAHIKDLKQLPEVESEVDKCIECGYCEHKCPSRDLTLTPRRRIVVRRAIATATGADRDTLLSQYQYDGLDTCSTDGLCATECPVDIDTGQLVRRLRKENHSRFANVIATTLARHFGLVETLVRLSLRTRLPLLIRSFRRLLKTQHQPINIRPNKPVNPQFLYFATCINRSMGTTQLVSLAQRASIALLIPPQLHGRCCGQPFSSKGFDEAARLTRNATIQWLWQHSDHGRLPIVMDLSSCTHSLRDCRPHLDEHNKTLFDQLTILDLVDFLHDELLPHLTIKNKKASIALHPVCSLTKMRNAHKLTAIAHRCAHHVFIPPSAGCCGMAGDRGFRFPELIRAAITPESIEISAATQTHAASHPSFDGFYSTSTTCEMALSAITQKNYQSILQLLTECI